MEDILSIFIPVLFVVGLVLERVAPARPLPKVKRWLVKGFVFFVLSGAINALLPALFAERIGSHAPVNLSGLGVLAGAVAALIVSELAMYWIHRTLHRFHFLWRWTHQMHHSAERIDVAGAVYFHPFDISLQLFATTAAVALLGVRPEAAALAGFVSFLCGVFQHLNVRTPWWLGFVVQRPEGHSVHHQRGLHAYNYGNLALWDLVFGTFRNPRDFSPVAGFWDGASAEVGAMLLGRDVGEPRPQSTAAALEAPSPAE
jgi:sterol desaturase/sphingolipid hydroxylase (fatty acid hydroxylase superfamily)